MNEDTAIRIVMEVVHNRLYAKHVRAQRVYFIALGLIVAVMIAYVLICNGGAMNVPAVAGIQ